MIIKFIVLGTFFNIKNAAMALELAGNTEGSNQK